MPQRIRLSRRRGWRKPEGAVVVARPSRWGNPFRLAEYKQDHPRDAGFTERDWRRLAVDDFRRMIEGRRPAPGRYPGADEIRDLLAGHDLACWCPLDEPCHADVLLEVANGSPPVRRSGTPRRSPR